MSSQSFAQDTINDRDSESSREAARMEVVKSLNILDSEREWFFDAVVALTLHICNAPVGAISIVDTDRQWFKAAFGIAVEETPRSISFCTHTIQQYEPLVVQDARSDSRFANSPLVVEEGFQFYAGVALRVDGKPVGALCINDYVPRTLTPAQINGLEILAGIASSYLRTTHHASQV